jgi:hypothetical protein
VISRTKHSGRGHGKKDIFNHLNFFSFLFCNNGSVFSCPVVFNNHQNSELAPQTWITSTDPQYRINAHRRSRYAGEAQVFHVRLSIVSPQIVDMKSLKRENSRILRHGDQLGCSCKLGCLDHIALANLAILGTWDSDVDGDFLVY